MAPIGRVCRSASLRLKVVADAGYGSAEMVGWLVDERGIEPHVKLMDKSGRKGLRAQTQVLPERSCTQDRTLHS